MVLKAKDTFCTSQLLIRNTLIHPLTPLQMVTAITVEKNC